MRRTRWCSCSATPAEGCAPLSPVGVRGVYLVCAQVRYGGNGWSTIGADGDKDVNRSIAIAEERWIPSKLPGRPRHRARDFTDKRPVQQIRGLQQSERRVPPVVAGSVGNPVIAGVEDNRRVAHDILKARPAHRLPHGIAIIERRPVQGIWRYGNVEPLVTAEIIRLEMRHHKARTRRHNRALNHNWSDGESRSATAGF